MRIQAVETPLRTDSIDTLLEGLRARGASDVHIVAERPPLARVAGALKPMGDVLGAAEVERLVMPMVHARLRPDLTANGSVDFSYESPGAGRSRVNLGRQRTGLKAVFRLIPRTTPTIEALGLPSDLRKVTEHHQGLVVITGPTGHGKTTTLAAIVDLVNSETTHHVITVEDPVEYVHERKRAMMSQREVGAHTRSFQAALKGSLREDPDVIVVGELRDTETVRIALSASETGHLVIGTMNTPSAAKTIDRLIDLFPPGDQPQVRMTLAGGLRLVVSQRLVPRLDGQGMAVAVELLPGMVPLWNLIRDGKTFQIPSLQQRGKGLGIIRLDDSLVELVKNGVTSLEAAREVADSPDEVSAAVERKDPPETPATPEPTGGARGLFGNVFGGKKG
jgi:twitching motility protein PilT